MPYRTFLAMDIDDRTREALASVRERLGRLRGRINWVAPENLHSTVQFLGDVEDAQLGDVCHACDRAGAAIEPFSPRVEGIRARPPRGRVRMLWAEVAEQTGRMHHLHECVEEALADIGFQPEDRTWRPHVTVARVRHTPDPATLREALENLDDVRFEPFTVGHCTVYTSELTPHGPIYTVAHRSPLTG